MPTFVDDLRFFATSHALGGGSDVAALSSDGPDALSALDDGLWVRWNTDNLVNDGEFTEAWVEAVMPPVVPPADGAIRTDLQLWAVYDNPSREPDYSVVINTAGFAVGTSITQGVFDLSALTEEDFATGGWKLRLYFSSGEEHIPPRASVNLDAVYLRTWWEILELAAAALWPLRQRQIPKVATARQSARW